MVNNQKGYALLITLILLLLVSVLGIAMMTTNLTAATQNKTRESVVQSEDLAVKGAEFFSMSLQSELEKSINNTRLTVPEYINKLKSILQKNAYQCLNGNVIIPTDITGTTNVCIEKIYIEGNQNPTATQLAAALKWIVVVKSTSVVNGQTRTVRQHIMYGTDNVPDQLRYALSSNQSGNLYLHGGIDIYGDVKTEGNLILSNTAFWKSNNEVRWVDSLAPRIISRSFTPKVILPPDNNYNVYTMKDTSSISDFDFNNGHLTGKYFKSGLNSSERNFLNRHYDKHNIGNPSDVSTIKNYLTDGNNVNFERRSLPADNLNISDQISLNKNTVTYRNLFTTSINNNLDTRFTTNKNSSFYFGAESYCARWSWFVCVETRVREANSNLNISSSNTSSPLVVKGIYFINGNLNISNTILNSDAIFYVNGSVSMTNSSIVDGSNLFIFSNGEIEISNMSVDKNTPSKIKGFFYTKENFLMYGVGSNIYLNGGISAKRIVLTGLRGKSSNNTFDSVTNQNMLISGERIASRLTIDYDPNLIPEFITFTRPADTELTPTMNQPLIINQE